MQLCTTRQHTAIHQRHKSYETQRHGNASHTHITSQPTAFSFGRPTCTHLPYNPQQVDVAAWTILRQQIQRAGNGWSYPPQTNPYLARATPPLVFVLLTSHKQSFFR